MTRRVPLILQVQTDVDHLVTRLAAVKARLDQLGPTPDAKAPHEAPQVTKERLQQQQEYETVDALVKRAKLLLVQAQQANARIAARQHAKFTHSLFERNASLFDPEQWLNIGAETPHNFKLARTAIGDWVQAVDAKLTFGPALTFWASVVILLAIYRPLALFSRRAAVAATRRHSAEPLPQDCRRLVGRDYHRRISAAGIARSSPGFCTPSNCSTIIASRSFSRWREPSPM